MSDHGTAASGRLTTTAVVPTRNRGAMIAEGLRSLLAQQHADLRILVIDQSTDDLTRRAVEAVAGDDRRVRIYSTRTVGLSAARNVAMRLADTDVIAFTDDDCVLDPGWLSAIVREFEQPDVGAVFGRVVPPGSGKRMGTEVAFKPARDREVYTGFVPPWYIGHGANMALRRADLLALGGFDPQLGAGTSFPAGEDLDISYRLLRSGRRVVYTGDALAYHKDWRDWRSRRRTERGYGIGAGALFMKYLRCGDRHGARLLATWVWQLGVRRVGAGLLKWRSLKPVYLGYCQLVYPWIGMLMSLALPVDRRHVAYIDRAAAQPD